MGTAPPTAPREDRILGRKISPLTRRRLHNFRANARGFWSFWIFLAIFFVTLFAGARTYLGRPVSLSRSRD